MYRIIICDDDSVVLERIEKIVCEMLKRERIRAKVHCFNDAAQISTQLLSSCDIALFDIDFGNEQNNGINLARELRMFRRDSIIIFITNYIEYAPEGYEVRAFRYVLKRNLDTELTKCLDLAFKMLYSSLQTIKIQVNGEIIDLIVDEILYLEVRQHNITIYYNKPRNKTRIMTYQIYGSLSNYQEKLEQHGFLRIHKSFLVNMRHIVKYQCREVILDNGIKLCASEKNYAVQKKKYLLWRGWQ